MATKAVHRITLLFTLLLGPRKGYFDFNRKKCYQKETLCPYLHFQDALLALFVRVKFEEHSYEATLHMNVLQIFGETVCWLTARWFLVWF